MGERVKRTHRACADDGATVLRTELRSDGRWLGNIVIEYDDKARFGRLYTITDYGNYSCGWYAVSKDGFLEFLGNAGGEYLVEKLAAGHDEKSVFDAEATRESVKGMLMVADGEDADYIGACICEMEDLECEADFYAWAEENEVDDICEYFTYGLGGHLNGYLQNVVPAIKRFAREEMKRGKETLV